MSTSLDPDHAPDCFLSTISKDLECLFVCLFCCFTSQVSSYGYGGAVSSSNHTFFLGKFEHVVNQYFVHILSLVTDNPS